MDLQSTFEVNFDVSQKLHFILCDPASRGPLLCALKTKAPAPALYNQSIEAENAWQH